jgi:hypothetical protein
METACLATTRKLAHQIMTAKTKRGGDALPKHFVRNPTNATLFRTLWSATRPRATLILQSIAKKKSGGHIRTAALKLSNPGRAGIYDDLYLTEQP